VKGYHELQSLTEQA